MSGENNAGAVIIGCFLLVCGAGLGVLGGCCSLLLVWDAISRTSGNFGETLPFFMISLVMLLGGGGLAWLGVKIMTGGGTAPPPPEV